jgi:hypothetical protein
VSGAHRPRALVASALVAAGLGGPAAAIDGVTEINQARALSGGVTPGDGPGFPVKIDRPGSYRLTGSLDVSAQPGAEDLPAIWIDSSFVTLDLNGFSLVGPVTCSGSPVTGCSASGDGDGVHAPLANWVRIHDGFVRGFGRHGIHGANVAVENVQAYSNAGAGIHMLSGGRVTYGISIANGGPGISGSGTLVVASRAVDNGGPGFFVPNGQLHDCDAVHNSSFGIAVAGGLVVGNLSRDNGSYALIAPGGAFTRNLLAGADPVLGSGIAFGPNLCNGALCP